MRACVVKMLYVDDDIARVAKIPSVDHTRYRRENSFSALKKIDAT
jgi:hypothetical protein